MSGIFGIVSKGDCSEILLHGTDYHSHLGTEYGGLAVLGELAVPVKKIHDIRNSQFKSEFVKDYKHMKGKYGIGVISDKDPQPLVFNSKFGPFALCVTGLIENKEELASQLIKNGGIFSETSNGTINSTELVAKMINKGDDIIDGIKKMFEKIEGSVSLLLLNKDGVYAARDRKGYTPLVVGKMENNFAIASESSSFHNLGFEIIKYLSPGEMILITESGVKQKTKGEEGNKICAFLWIYTGFPTSSYEGVNVEAVREKCGRALARKDDVNADFVAGVPDSGIAHAIGYAMESGLPYRRPLVKYTPGYGRSYTPPSQEIRDKVALMKLIANKEIIEGNRIVLCEDSIVRGTQLRNYTIKKLWDAGAKEVHIRPACPPLMFPCRFNLSTRSIHELAARRAIKALEGSDIEDVSKYIDQASENYKKMVDWIAKDLLASSLMYQDIDDMVEAIGLPKEKLCLYCWNGKV